MKKTHIERKADLAIKLQKKYLKTKLKTARCAEVGKLVGISGMSVQNYMTGRISDGYLAEDILRVW